MDTKKIGERSEICIMAELIKRDKVVLLPFGDNQRYDMVIDENGKFIRIQCKTGRLKKGVIKFSTSSSTVHRKNGIRRTYIGDADLFAVYCEELNKVYIIPVIGTPSISMHLRIDPTHNNQSKNIKFAADYELK